MAVATGSIEDRCMDPQTFEKRRRAIVFLSTAAAVAAVGGIVSCESPQGMKPAPGGRRDGRSPTDEAGQIGRAHV